MKSWSEIWERCRRCELDTKPHEARGLCKRCYDIENGRHCIDCGKPITQKATRCKPCATLHVRAGNGKTDRAILQEFSVPSSQSVKRSVRRVWDQIGEMSRPASSARPQFEGVPSYERGEENAKSARVGGWYTGRLW